MSCWELGVLLVVQPRQSLVVTGTRKLPLLAGGWLIGQSGRGKCPSQWAMKDSRPRILTLLQKLYVLLNEFSLLTSKNYSWCRNELYWKCLCQTRWMQVVQNHKVVLPALTALFSYSSVLPKSKALALKCQSERELQSTIHWISKIMSVHISSPFYNLSSSHLAKCIAL